MSVESVDAVVMGGSIQIEAVTIELLPERLSVTEADTVQSRIERQIRRAEIVDGRIAGLIRGVAHSQVCGARHERFGGDADILRHSTLSRAAHATDDHAEIVLLGKRGGCGIRL